MRQLRSVGVVGLFLVGILLGSDPALGVPFRLRVEDVGAGVGLVVTDDGACDLNPLAGQIVSSTSVGQFTVAVTTGAFPGLGVTFGPGAFSAASTVPVSGTGPAFSLFAQADIVFTGAGSVSFADEQGATPVPEPVSAALSLTGLAVLGLSLFRRRERTV